MPEVRFDCNSNAIQWRIIDAANSSSPTKTIAGTNAGLATAQNLKRSTQSSSSILKHVASAEAPAVGEVINASVNATGASDNAAGSSINATRAFVNATRASVNATRACVNAARASNVSAVEKTPAKSDSSPGKSQISAISCFVGNQIGCSEVIINQSTTNRTASLEEG